MHRLTVGQQNDAQIPAVEFRNRTPSPYASILLQFFSDRIVNHPLNPVQRNKGAIGALSGGMKVVGESHGTLLSNNDGIT